MDGLEIYGIKVNDIKDVREVLTILYVIQEQQKDILERQASIMQSAEKLFELTDKLDSLLSKMDEVEQNLEKFVKATRITNENIQVVHGVVSQISKDIQKIQGEISSLTEDSRQAIEKAGDVALVEISEASDILKDKVEREVISIMQSLEKRIGSTIDNAVQETTKKVGSLSTIVNIKAFLISVVLGIILGFVLNYHNFFFHLGGH